MNKNKEKIKKKTIVMTIIGIAFMLVLILTSTYAYFMVNATNSTSRTVITGKTENVGNATLSTLVTSLHINLSATDMAKRNAGKYYATSDNNKDYEPNKSLGYYDLAQLSLTSSDDAEDNNIYTCNTTLKITLDTAEQDSMISELQTGDVIFHTFVNGHNTDYDLSDIKETGSKEIEVEIESVGSNTKNIRGYLEFTNKKEDDQSKLSGKNLKVTIETKGLSCNVTGKAVEADSTKVKSFISDNNASASKLSFVDYIDESGEEGQDLSLAKDGSIKGWVNDSTIYIGSNKSKIMIRDMSNIFDLGYSTNYSVILDNLTFDRNTKLG